jgi:hypothetical protein
MRIVLGMMIVAAVVSIRCEGPPSEEIQRAKAARARADAARADFYVRDTYGLAAMSYNDGEAALKSKEWDKAGKSYAAAARQFDEAAKSVLAGHEAMKKELRERMDEMLEDHMKMIRQVDVATAKMGKIDKAKLAELMADCQATMGAAIEALDRGDLITAKEMMDKDDAIHVKMMAIIPPQKGFKAK